MTDDRLTLRIASGLLWLGALDPLFDSVLALAESRWLYAAWSALAVAAYIIMGRAVWRAS